MRLLQRCWRSRLPVALATVGLVVLAGCSRPPFDPTERDLAAPVVALRIDEPVHAPVWWRDGQALLALTDDSRIAKIVPVWGPDAPFAARTVLSEPFPDVGENIMPSPTDEAVAFLPQPRLGRVAVIDIATLRQVGTLRAGPAPSYLAVDSGSKVLLALSEDGSTVTSVDLLDDEVLATNAVWFGPEAEVDGPPRGRLIEFHVVGPAGVAHYKGAAGEVERLGRIPLSGGSSATDRIDVSRVYVAERDTDRLVAVGTPPTADGLEVIAEARLGEPVEHLAVDEARIYAATATTMTVFETNSFEGYPDNSFPVLARIDYRTALEDEALEAAPLSGIAVGMTRVYLSLEGEPYLVSIAKPPL
jgi:hypothetical protein